MVAKQEMVMKMALQWRSQVLKQRNSDTVAK